MSLKISINNQSWICQKKNTFIRSSVVIDKVMNFQEVNTVFITLIAGPADIVLC